MRCCDRLWLIFLPKIPEIVPEFLLGKDKRIQELLMLEKQHANCIHTNITRESVMISSAQVLLGEKCQGMDMETQRLFKCARLRSKIPTTF